MFPKVSDGHTGWRVASLALFGRDIDAKDFLFLQQQLSQTINSGSFTPQMINGELLRLRHRNKRDVFVCRVFFSKPGAAVDLQIYMPVYV